MAASVASANPGSLISYRSFFLKPDVAALGSCNCPILGLPLPAAANVKSVGERRTARRSRVGLVALFGGGKKAGGEEKKFISKEEEPDQYWQTAAEKEARTHDSHLWDVSNVCNAIRFGAGCA